MAAAKTECNTKEKGIDLFIKINLSPFCCNLTVKVTKWKSRSTGNIYYGPVRWGTNRLSQTTQWDSLISTGKITEDDKKIICVMTENEGKIEAVQSYDSEIITAGAMQKNYQYRRNR